MDIHRPNQRQAFIFFSLIIIACVGILGWVFFFNKGYVIVSGQAPFAIQTAGVDMICDTSPCKVILSPRSYGFTFAKEGFFQETKEVAVQRGIEQKIDVTFNLIPHIKKIEPRGVASSFSPLWPPYIGGTTLKNFPKQAKGGIFSHSGLLGLAAIGKEVYWYDQAASTLSQTDLSSSSIFTFAGEEVVVLGSEDQKPVLKKWTANSDESSSIVVFERAFESPELHGDTMGKFVLIEDHTSTGSKFYLVDIASRSRRALSFEETLHFVHWIDSGMVFEKEDADGTQVVVINPDTSTETKIAHAVSGATVTENKEGIVYISKKAPGENSPLIGISIGEAIDLAVDQSIGSAPPTAWYIVKIGVDKKEVSLATISNTSLPILRLENDPATGQIYFEQGEEIFTLVTGS